MPWKEVAFAAYVLLLVGCRGDGPTNPSDQTSATLAKKASAPLRFIAIRTGVGNTCGIATGNIAYCWGLNNFGQSGTGRPDATLARPTPVSGEHKFIGIDLNYTHVCALAADGWPYCWGANDVGQLGNGTVEGAAVPLPIARTYTTATNPAFPHESNVRPLTGEFLDIAVGAFHSCGLVNSLLGLGLEPADADGRVVCWGSNVAAQLGPIGPRLSSALEPVLVPIEKHLVSDNPVFRDTGIDSIDSGTFFTCWVGSAYAGEALPSVPAIPPGERGVQCWGSNQFNPWALLSVTAAFHPTLAFRTEGSDTWTLPQSHGATSCRIVHSRRVYCSGDNSSGQLGNGHTEHAFPSVQVALPLWAVSVSSGYQHSCAVLEDGSAWCWGSNAFGQLGTGDVSLRSVPTRVQSTIKFKQIDAGNSHTCALAVNGTAYCWGSNGAGELGDGSYEGRLVPTLVANPSQS
jgi:alpha-tubulin suppressor-like RCC1 family protein